MIDEICKWCGGKGCLVCDVADKKAQEELPTPIFTAKYDNKDDMTLLKKTFGKEALDKAFGDGGGGMDEILENAKVASLLQSIRGISQK